MRYDLETERLEPFLGGLSAEQLDFSPDGEWVAYLTYPQESVWRSRVDGSERLQLTPPEMRAALPRWSPDGRRIALAAAVRGRRWQTHVVDADGGGLELLLPADARGVGVSWAPDGRRLAFGETGPERPLGLLDLATREVTPLPGPGGSPVFSPRWSPDGRYLAAMSPDSSALLLYEFETGSWTRLVEGHIGWPTWTRDGRRLCFDYAEPGTTNVGGRDARPACLRVPDGPLERLAVIRGARRASGSFGTWHGFAPDGSPLVLRDHGTQDVYALEWIAPGE